MLDIAASRILHEPEHGRTPGMPRTWLWPLPRLDGLEPCVLSPTEAAAHDGVGLGYPGRSSAADFVPVFAARDGVVAYAGGSYGRSLICLDHVGGWSTQYAELARILVMPTDRFHRRRKVRVQAGDVVGHLRPDALRMRFSLARLADGQWSFVNPVDAMLHWTLLPWFESQPHARKRNAV